MWVVTVVKEEYILLHTTRLNNAFFKTTSFNKADFLKSFKFSFIQ